MSIDPAVIDRFRADLTAVAGGPVESLGVGVSGGADSLALLLLANAAVPGRIRVATVDHGLRLEARDEAEFVSRLCKARHIPHAILGPEPIDPGNVQGNARALRYRLLDRWARDAGIGHVAVAHHQGDVAEGFLMRAARGAGISGLACMRASRALGEGVTLVRPLLDWDPAELRAIVAAAGIDPIEDPSNRDPHYDRVRYRALIASSPDLSVRNIALAARNVADADAALDWLADEAWGSRVVRQGPTWLLDPEALPHDTVRRLALRIIAALRGASHPPEGIDGLIDRLRRGEHATLAGISADPGPPWRFVIAPPRSA